MPITSSDTIERAEALFAGGMKSIKVAEKLRISVGDALELKNAWLIKTAKPQPAKAEQAAPKAKKAKADAADK